MKNKIVLLLSLIVLSCNGNTKDSLTINFSNSKQNLKRYDIKSGIVKYKTTTIGKVMGSNIKGTGTESLYFKNWGAVELTETKSTKTTKMHFLGNEKINSQNTHTISKLENGKSYSVDFNNATIYLQRDPMTELMKNTNTDAGNSGKEMLIKQWEEKSWRRYFFGIFL